MPAAKQVIYVDVDDEITSVIDKVNEADAKVIALVLPKRATVFQSVVNMKLLKRKAEQASKHLVLITSEASLMPLAGVAGLHVAPTLQSKPEVPVTPGADNVPDDIEEDTVESDEGFDANAAQSGTVPVGALAGTAAAGVNSASNLPEDVQEVNKPAAGGKASPQMAALAAAGSGGANGVKDAAKKSKDKKLQVPNFLKFRKRLVFIGLGLVALIVLWYFAWFVWPTAMVSIKTKTSDINASFEATLDTKANDVDVQERTVPAKTEQQQKNNTQQTPATGQENRGNKATGQVTLTNCSKSSDNVNVPAGTGLSMNGMTFLTQNSVQLGSSSFDFNQNCKSTGDSSKTVNVIAQKPGTSYNVGSGSFAVAGMGSVQARSEAAFSGGTDSIVKVVQQGDIDAAKAKITSGAEKDAVSKQLQNTLEDAGYLAVLNSLHTSATEAVTSNKVGEEAEAVTVSQTVTYTMYGAKKGDLRKLVEAEVEGKIDKEKQGIIDDGLDEVKFSLDRTDATPQIKVNLIANVVAGPDIDIDGIKREMTGQKSGAVQDRIKTYPGVENVTVKYSPFWVTKAPKPGKTTIVFEKSDGSKTEAGSNSTNNSSNGSGSQGSNQ